MRLSPITRRLACAILLAASIVATAADKKEDQTLSLTANAALNAELSSPQVPQKQKAAVKDRMNSIANDLYRANHYDLETLRDGEIIIAIVPTDLLFPPNETELMADSGKLLDPFISFIRDKDRFKVAITANSDDTGSEEYLLDLTEARINAVLDYFESKNIIVDDVVGFPMGDSDPLVDNDTRANRAKNRRIEFYIIPNTGLFNNSKR